MRFYQLFILSFLSFLSTGHQALGVGCDVRIIAATEFRGHPEAANVLIAALDVSLAFGLDDGNFVRVLEKDGRKVVLIRNHKFIEMLSNSPSMQKAWNIISQDLLTQSFKQQIRYAERDVAAHDQMLPQHKVLKSICHVAAASGLLLSIGACIAHPQLSWEGIGQVLRLGAVFAAAMEGFVLVFNEKLQGLRNAKKHAEEDHSKNLISNAKQMDKRFELKTVPGNAQFLVTDSYNFDAYVEIFKSLGYTHQSSYVRTFGYDGSVRPEERN